MNIRFATATPVQRAGLVTLLLVASLAHGTSQADHRSPVRRISVDLQADLLAALVRSDRHDEAVEICRQMLESVDPESAAAAWWSCQFSQILSQTNRAAGAVSDQMIQTAQQPVASLLIQFPDHASGVFLEFQRISVLGDAAAGDVIEASVAFHSDVAVDRALRRMLEVEQALDQLSDDIAAELSQTSAGGRASVGQSNATSVSQQQPRESDLRQLSQRVVVSKTQVNLLRSELFPLGSPDQVAAAAKSISVGQAAIGRLPAGSEALASVHQLLIQAYLRAGRTADAGRHFDAVFGRWDVAKMPDADQVALRLQIAAAGQDEAMAQSILDATYGSGVAVPSESLALDLARLQWLFATDRLSQSDRPTAVTSWIGQLAGKHGQLARRRAEAITLGRLGGQSGGGREGDRGDAELLAIQGRDLVRRGELDRGATMLRAACLQQPEPALAVQTATQAAAAFAKRGDLDDAAAVLKQAALRHPQQSPSSGMFLQSIVLQTKQEPAAAATITDDLETLIRTWPRSDAATQAVSWVTAIFTRQGDPLSAATVITWRDPSTWTVAQTERAMQIWQSIIHGADASNVQTLLDRFAVLVNQVASNNAAADVHAVVMTYAVLLMDRGDLRQIVSAGRDALMGLPNFIGQLAAFRTADGTAPALSESPTDAHQSAAVWRLMRDAEIDSKLRDFVATVLDQWHVGKPDDVASMTRMIWNGQVDKAVQIADRLLQSSNDRGGLLMRIANAFSAASDAADRRHAVHYFDQFTAGTKVGSAAWHASKLAAIEVLAINGKPAEAKQRAAYVLLTSPPDQPEVLSRYRKFATVAP